MSIEEAFTVEGLPPAWGKVVGIHLKEVAKYTETVFGIEGEYQRTLGDENLREDFILNAKIYSLSLWRWSTENVPKDVIEWVLGRGNWKKCLAIDRYKYLINRRSILEGWDMRRKVDQTPHNIEVEALRLMEKTGWMSLAVAINDIEFFKCIVSTRKITETSELKYLYMTYWMIWSLWDGSLDTTMVNFKKRLGLDVSKTTLHRLRKDLGLTREN
jgi:hypothetical protein